MDIKLTEAPKSQAKFTSGSTMRHVISMTMAGAAGLMALFMVDIINLFYIAQLGDQSLTAAIGFAATIMFFSISLSIGLSIAATALTARAIGSGDIEKARKIATASLIYVIVVNVTIATVIYLSLEWLLGLLGATGRTFDEALDFLQIVTISSPLMGIAMCFGGLLRAQGDARLAMYVTLSGGVATAILDPIFIFGLEMGITGAAVATFLARVIFVIVGVYGTHFVHRLLGRVGPVDIFRYAGGFFAVAVPAIVTQVATPVGNAYVTFSISEFGDDAIAGWTIVGRIIPLAFGTIFSLSGAIGPIIAQNYRAHLSSRVSQTQRDALFFTLLYTVFAWVMLIMFRNFLVDVFDASGDAAEMVRFFCLFVASSFLFNGALFVANAAFNNLGHPLYATFFNWGRATLGVIPFVYVGQSYGPLGVLAGWGLGAVVFGILSVVVSFKLLKQLPQRAASAAARL